MKGFESTVVIGKKRRRVEEEAQCRREWRRDIGVEIEWGKGMEGLGRFGVSRASLRKGQG